MTHRIPIKLHLTGKSRLIFKFIQLNKDEVVTNRSYHVCKKLYPALELSNVILKRSFPPPFYSLNFSLVDKLQDA